MIYMGSKARIAPEILPIILKDRSPGQWYVEPFVGGANIIDKVTGKRIGADVNEYLIKALILIRDNPNDIPDIITEDDYADIKKKKNLDGLTGLVGFGMSFGEKWFGGYRRENAGERNHLGNMQTQTRRLKASTLKQSPGLQGVDFISGSYSDLKIPAKSIIYCDPPYENTTGYKDSFDHSKFWEWCRQKHKEGHSVFVSEYNAPADFIVVWQKNTTTNIDSNVPSKIATEKLFTLPKSAGQNYYLLQPDMVIYPKGVIRVPVDVPEDLFRRYLATRRMTPVRVPIALLTLMRRFGCGPIRKIQMSLPVDPFRHEPSES